MSIQPALGMLLSLCPIPLRLHAGKSDAGKSDGYRLFMGLYAIWDAGHVLQSPSIVRHVAEVWLLGPW